MQGLEVYTYRYRSRSSVSNVPSGLNRPRQVPSDFSTRTSPLNSLPVMFPLISVLRSLSSPLPLKPSLPLRIAQVPVTTVPSV
ncbi:hypothetical protein D3C80_1873240 [compost metagenome]